MFQYTFENVLKTHRSLQAVIPTTATTSIINTTVRWEVTEWVRGAGRQKESRKKK